MKSEAGQAAAVSRSLGKPFCIGGIPKKQPAFGGAAGHQVPVGRQSDGIDGTVSDAVFVAPTGSDASAGTKGAPLRTVTAGVTAAASNGLLIGRTALVTGVRDERSIAWGIARALATQDRACGRLAWACS